jgi:hypothetical protein
VQEKQRQYGGPITVKTSSMDHFKANIEKKKLQKQTLEARNLQRKEI